MASVSRPIPTLTCVLASMRNTRRSTRRVLPARLTRQIELCIARQTTLLANTTPLRTDVSSWLSF
eukprot:3669078-Prymnesium_polylepis.1